MQLQWHKIWLKIGYLLVLIVIVSSLLPPPPGSFVWRFDKLIHASSYAVLMGWFLQLYRRQLRRLGLVLAFILMGVSLEIAQAFHPLRHFDYWDMLANSLGVLIAWLLGFTAFGQALMHLEFFIQRHWVKSKAAD